MTENDSFIDIYDSFLETQADKPNNLSRLVVDGIVSRCTSTYQSKPLITIKDDWHVRRHCSICAGMHSGNDSYRYIPEEADKIDNYGRY